MIHRTAFALPLAFGIAISACGGAPAPVVDPAGSTQAGAPKGSTSLPPSEGIGLGTTDGGQPNTSPTPSTNGRIDPRAVQEVVRNDRKAMRRCYEAGLGRDPNLQGKLAVRFVIALDGTVSSAVDIHDAPPTSEARPGAVAANDVPSDRDHRAEPRFPDAEVTWCVLARFKSLKFPHPEGGPVTVVYPFIFRASE